MRSLKADLKDFFRLHHAANVPSEAQQWSVDDDARVESFCREPALAVTLTGSAADELARSRLSWQAEQQRKAAIDMVAWSGIVASSAEECCSELARLWMARSGLVERVELPLPDELAALCTTSLYSAAQQAVIRLASTLRITDAVESFSATGISAHSRRIVSFNMGATPPDDGEGTADADSARSLMWEWRCDEGNIDGFEYLRSELAWGGNPVLHLDYDEDAPRGKPGLKTWTSADAGAAVATIAPPSGSLSPAEVYACLECVVPPAMRPTRHGYIFLRTGDGGGDGATLFEAGKPLLEYRKLASHYWCKTRPD